MFALACLLQAGCATYSDRTAQALADFRAGRLEQAMTAYEDPDTTGSPFLRGAEAGTVALAAGDWERARSNLDRAAAEVRELEDRALAAPESLQDGLLSWALNESSRDYPGEGFERVLLHAQLAIVYLARGDLSAAQVEVRRANALLETEQELYEKEYEAGGLGHFLSAITYELDRKPDEAYIDYKRMEAKGVGRELAGRALVRLARRLHFEDDLRVWIERYGDEPDPPADSASIVVVAGVGLGPYKRELALTIPTPEGLLQWAVPAYVERPTAGEQLVLSIAGGNRSVQTVVVEDVTRVARENLEDRIGWLAGKSAIRSVLKLALARNLRKEAGVLGQIAGDVFTFVTERADLRGWQTLPASWQAARVFLPPGVHALVLHAVGGEGRELGSFELAPGETMFIFARTLDARLHAHPVGGQRPAASLKEPLEP